MQEEKKNQLCAWMSQYQIIFEHHNLDINNQRVLSDCLYRTQLSLKLKEACLRRSEFLQLGWLRLTPTSIVSLGWKRKEIL